MVVSGALAFGFRDYLIKETVEVMISDATGFHVQIEDLQHEFPAVLTLHNVTLQNPPGFEAELFAKAPYFYIDLDLHDLFTKNIFHIRLWRLIITELHIEKNRRGVVNGKVLKNIKNLIAAKPGTHQDSSGSAPGFRLDRLVVEIKRVDYVNRTGVAVKRFKKMRLAPSVYENITDFSSLIDTIIDKILKESDFSKYFQLGQYYFSRSVDGAAKALQKLSVRGIGNHKGGEKT